jgi:hypothetical protein
MIPLRRVNIKEKALPRCESSKQIQELKCRNRMSKKLQTCKKSEITYYILVKISEITCKKTQININENCLTQIS